MRVRFDLAFAMWLLVVGVSSGPVLRAQTESGDARGVEVYAAQKCAVCHSIAGKGNQKGALDDVGSRLSAEEIRMWIMDAKGMTAKTKAPRKPVMRTYNLPKEDVDALVRLLEGLKKP